jgi:hypothetical protein
VPADVVPVLTDAAELARAHRQNLIVVSGLGDPATAHSVCAALEEMHALGAPPPFKIAFVAFAFPQYSAYHFAERYAQRFGIEARVMVSVRDATAWLGPRERKARPPESAEQLRR